MPFPELRAQRLLTERLQLRCYLPGDAAELQAVSAANQPHLSRFLPWSAADPQSVEEKLALIGGWQAAFATGSEAVYRIERRGDPRLIGGCGLHSKSDKGMEIGYWVEQPSQGQGIATEVTAALTRFTLEVQRPARVIIHCEPANAASNRIAEKLGYHRDGVLRRAFPWPGELNRDLVHWTLLPEELAASPAASAVYEAFDDKGHRLVPQDG